MVRRPPCRPGGQNEVARGGSSVGQSSGLIIRQVVGSSPTRPTLQHNAVVVLPPAVARPRVSWFELFYDLVLVAAILHGSHVFSAAPSWETGFWLAVTLLILLAVWLLTTLTFNVIRDDWVLRRLLALVQMIAVVVASLSVSRDDGLSDRIGFIALAVAFASISILYAVAAGQAVTDRRRSSLIAALSGLAALVFLAGSALPESDAPIYANPSTYVLVIGLALILTPLLTSGLGQLSASGALDREHLAERMGQIVIIALGESFAALILSLGALQTIPNPVYLVLTFVVIYCLWTIYFRSVLPSGIPDGAGRLRAWIAGHYLLLFGLIGTAEAFASLTVVPFDDQAMGYASYRMPLPLLYVMVSFTLLTLLAGRATRRLMTVHAAASVGLLGLCLAGAGLYRDHAMTMGILAGAVVIADAVVIALLSRRHSSTSASAWAQQDDLGAP